MPQLSSGHVFISYSRRDDAVMRRIVTFLRQQGIKVWVDNEKLIPGTPIWEEEIEKAIKNAPAIVVVLSPDSKNSEWVRREISLADQYRNRVFPVLVRGDEETSISLRLIGRQFVDIRKDEDAGLNSVSASLLRYLEELKAQEQKAKEEAARLAAQKARNEKKLAKQKADEERLAQEKIESENRLRKAKEEAERLSAQRTEEERIAKAKIETERLAEEKRLTAEPGKTDLEEEETTRTGMLRREHREQALRFKAEHDKLLQEKAELEKRLKEEQERPERIAQEKAEADNRLRKANEEAERFAVQRAEEAEKIARVQAERQAVELNAHEAEIKTTKENAKIGTAEHTLIGMKAEQKTARENAELEAASHKNLDVANKAAYKDSNLAVFPKVSNTLKNWGTGKKLLAASGVGFFAIIISCVIFFIWALRPTPPEQPVQFILPGGTPSPLPANTTSATVYKVVFSPDGKYLATASSKGGVQLWNVNSGTLLKTINEGGLFTVAFSPDGQSLAYSSSNTIFIRRISDGVLLNTFSGHTDFVNDLAFSPDGKIIASGSGDKTVRLWSTSNGTLLQTLEGQTDKVNSVAFSPDGRLLASGSDTKRIWDVSNGKLIKTIEGLSDQVAFSPDGQILASSYVYTDLWNINNYELLQSINSNASSGFSFSPDGQTIATGSLNTNTIDLWNVKDVAKLKSFEGHTAYIQSVAFSPDGTLIASGSGDGTIRLWNVTDSLTMATPEATTNPPTAPPPSSNATPTIPAASTLGIGSTMISEKDGVTLVYVPAGEFTMGSDNLSADEQPVHKVTLDAFWIDQTEVTNKMYAKCVSAGGCYLPSITDYYNNTDYANHPIDFVSWSAANAYCSWTDRRLPTEAEWEKAARGTDGRAYPWGNDAPDSSMLNQGLESNGTTAVKNYPKGVSPYGAYDMAGNVFEWVSSLYKPYPYDASDGRENMFSSDNRVLRGGSFNCSNCSIESALRYIHHKGDHTGFRCARSP